MLSPAANGIGVPATQVDDDPATLPVWIPLWSRVGSPRVPAAHVPQDDLESASKDAEPELEETV